jgi:glycosyltransferase involved in cell wall biosynthesis
MLASLDPASVAASALVTPTRTPNVALVHIVPTPYWQQLHRSFRQALPSVNVWSLYTHSLADQPWELTAQNDVRPVAFAQSGADPQRKISKIAHDLATAGRIISWLKANDIKAVVVYGYADAIRVRLIAWCKLHGIACFLAADSNIRGEKLKVSGLKAIAKRVIVTGVVKMCSGVMPFGTCGREYFRKYGVNENRVFPVPAGPDYALFRSITPHEVAQVRSSFNLAEGRKRLIYVGRLLALKRVDLLVDAFVKTADQRPDWDLLLVGDGPERANIESRIPAHLRSRVTFAGFVNDPHTLACLYRSSNALVLPSNTEAWGLVVNEALACGLAAIASDIVGASADLIIEGYNGRTFKSENLDSLIAAMSEVTDERNIGRMQASSSAVLAAFRSRFDPIDGLRNALRSVGVLPTPSGSPRPRPTAEHIVAMDDGPVRQVA